MQAVNYSFLIGLGSVLLIYLVYGVLSGKWKPSLLFEGADGKPSTSKFQWWLWIWVIAFAYITVYAARSIASGRPADPIGDIPGNTLAILGISTGGMALAKGITSSYVSSGALSKKTDGKAQSSYLVNDDSGLPDLSKLQLFVWTWVAVIIYLVKLVGQVVLASTQATGAQAVNVLTLPDVDTSLLLLSGLSTTGYIAKKVVTKQAPQS